MDGPLRSPGGGIRVRTTERGLPIALTLDPREFSRPPAQSARETLLLCQLSAGLMQVARRCGLIADGISPVVNHDLKPSTEDELARAEAELRDGDPDGAPDTWMRPV